MGFYVNEVFISHGLEFNCDGGGPFCAATPPMLTVGFDAGDDALCKWYDGALIANIDRISIQFRALLSFCSFFFFFGGWFKNSPANR